MSAKSSVAERGLPMRFVDPDRDSGTSAAVVVRPGESLAHTALMRPVDRTGKIVSPGEAGAQADRVLSNLNWALAAAGAGRENTVKMTVYVANDAVLAAVRDSVAQAFPGPVRPAVTWIVNRQPDPAILVTMDAVAVAPRTDAVAFHKSDLLASWYGAAHVSVMPPGEVFHLSGQAAAGAALEEAAANTVRELHRTLAHFGLEPEHVVQVKAFLPSMDDSATAVRAIAGRYGEGRCPPVVITERRAALPRSIEIEMIAINLRPGGEASAARYLAPPWLNPSPGFSHVTAANSGDRHGLIYFSGIVPPASLSADQQVAWSFDRLQSVCVRAGGNLDHLVKATYYVGDAWAEKDLSMLRPRYYSPQRSPAASLVVARGGARPGCVYTLDMIGLSGVQPGNP